MKTMKVPFDRNLYSTASTTAKNRVDQIHLFSFTIHSHFFDIVYNLLLMLINLLSLLFSSRVEFIDVYTYLV